MYVTLLQSPIKNLISSLNHLGLVTFNWNIKIISEKDERKKKWMINKKKNP